MIINGFVYFFFFCLVSLILCLIGYGITYSLQSREMAESFFVSWIFYFNGILVGGSGYGLLWYVLREGRNLLAMLNNAIGIQNLEPVKVVVYSRRANSWMWRNLIAIPITIVGAFLLWHSEFPLSGFAKYYLAVSAMSIYYVGACILVFFVFVLLMFKAIEESLEVQDLHKKVSPLEYASINNFLALTATMGVFAIYFGFRGTLTANFGVAGFEDSLRRFFILPLGLFLPATLVYSFYPRFVLKKLHDHQILAQIRIFEDLKLASQKKRATAKERLEVEKLLSEIKEKLVAERKQLPIIGYKDSPSLALVILMILQLIFQNDKIVRDFFRIF